jgi:pimeloyl-ACP methyl ester carboxylesterase
MSIEAFEQAQRRMLDRYGVSAESRFVEVALVQGRAHVLVSGHGPPVVMMNGIGTPAAMWAPLMARLRGFTLHAVDLPGYGLTDTTPQLTDSYRATAMAFIEQTLDQLDLQRAMFVSNSLGSLWTSWLALDRPERVSAMVHIGCPALILDTSAPIPMRMLSVPVLGKVLTSMQPPSPRQVEQLSKMVHQHPLVPELADLLLATERLTGFRSTFLRTLHTVLRLRGARPNMTLTGSQLAAINQPTQLIWGADDPMGSPSVGMRATEILPNSELHIVEGGHTPWLTAAETIGPIATSFLGKHRSTLR